MDVDVEDLFMHVLSPENGRRKADTEMNGSRERYQTLLINPARIASDTRGPIGPEELRTLVNERMVVPAVQFYQDIDSAGLCDYPPSGDSIRGFEALARIVHRERTIVTPKDFIPVAEQEHLLEEIDLQILRIACRLAREGNTHGHPDLYASVNVCEDLLNRENFPETVRSILGETGLAAHNLVLEVLENMRDISEETGETLRSLVGKDFSGVRIVMDDYGTGNSRELLRRLHTEFRLPISAIKVDGSFVKDIDTKPLDAVKECIDAAHDAGAEEIVWEGVFDGITMAEIQCLRRLKEDTHSRLRWLIEGRVFPQGKICGIQTYVIALPFLLGTLSFALSNTMEQMQSLSFTFVSSDLSGDAIAVVAELVDALA